MRYAPVLVLFAALGCGKKPAEEPSGPVPVSPATPKAEAPPLVDLQVIGRDYRENEIAADKKWKGKTIRTKVTAIGVIRNKGGTPTLGVHCGARTPALDYPDAAIIFPAEREAQAERIRPGDVVTIEAEVSGLRTVEGLPVLRLGDARVVE